MDSTERLETFPENEEPPGYDESLSKIKFIPRLYVPKGKITTEHAKQCIFPGENVAPEKKKQDLEFLKNEAKEWFRNELSKLMVAEIQDKQLTLKVIRNDNIMTVPVRNFEDFLEKIEQDNSDDMMKVIFHVSHGFFDQKDDWSVKLGNLFMKEYNFQYANISNHAHPCKGKGCFEMICCSEKTELVKRIQRSGKRSHGRYITLELPKKPNGAYTKRRMGKFYTEFIKTVNVDQTKISKKAKRYRQVCVLF